MVQGLRSSLFILAASVALWNTLAGTKNLPFTDICKVKLICRLCLQQSAALHKTTEKNRERYEYRTIQSYSDPGGIQESRPYIASVGRGKQVRILQVQDDCGRDITPCLAEFLEKGSKKQPKRAETEGLEHNAEWFGLAASKVLDAEEMLDYKRRHWAIENCLHYVLDETFGEDKSTIRQGKNTMSLLRKCAYNIARMLQMENPEEQGGIPDIIDNVCDNLEIGLQMIFSPIPSRY